MAKEAPIILVGGGTGGHIFPLIAIGEELSRRQIPFVTVGQRGGREETLFKELGWTFLPISAGKWRRGDSLSDFLANIQDLFLFGQGVIQSLRILRHTGAQTIFSKGGYVALPMVVAAQLLNRRLIIHESDTVMGMANRYSLKLADQVLTAFPSTVFPNQTKQFIQVGVPLSLTLRQAAKLKAPRKSRPLIFIIGGIQGAQAINQFVTESLSQLLPVADVVHGTGEKDYPRCLKVLESLEPKLRNHYKPIAYIGRQLSYYYQTSDLIVSRAGATTIAEAALFAKPIILIPLPTAAGDHQRINAEYLERAEAAVTLEQTDLTPTKFAKRILDLLQEEHRLERLGQNLTKYFNEDKAVDKVVTIITGNGQDQKRT